MMGRTAAVPVRSVGRVAVGASRMTVARAPSVAGGRPAARSMRLIGDDDRARSVVARAADDEPAAASAPAAGEPEFAFEPKKKIRPRRDGSKTKRAKNTKSRGGDDVKKSTVRAAKTRRAAK